LLLKETKGLWNGMPAPKPVHYRSASGALRAHKDPQKAATYRSYIKNTTGEVFLGIATPVLRRIAGEFWTLPLADVRRLMQSRVHEQRSLANEILRLKFHKGGAQQQQEVFHFYLRNRRLISSWDSVDGSAPYIVGCYLLKRNKDVLYQLALSPRIWDRRIAIVSTLWFVRRGSTRDALRLAGMLVRDQEDLIHKATGWVLREIGKKDVAALRRFLDAHCTVMPRTMLRYAIERFPQTERKKYLRRK
jgi:3-methyladenine DNA glycosylase AlkD